ncbi:MAG: arginase [Moorea sp. SIO3I7]|uniref:arginase n=1 Tax=unclassified Moorena TaxID=2683338 RepID=UPI0013BF760D|nr:MULTISPECIES: arginase [unclassified Moorena]NEN97430.1 arginase [Moorena sp. SIO3I7]NEO04827.1 arginase [Moorena sp. SIO3I8]NEO18564.1 arginase [Moorena sp. SIO4A5]NEP22411.1 arginase [Moorena sp. SIO3I6]
MNPIKIVEICSELGAAQLGASMGPDAIRMAAHKAGSHFFSEHPIIRLPERNALLADKNHNPGCRYAKRLRYILETCQIACNTVTDTLERGEFPLVLSADHSSAAGVIAGVKQAYPNERLGIIWIDAHSDMHSPYTTHSGNMHGMPLGAVLALDQEARTLLGASSNELPLAAQKQWTHLKELGGIVPKVLSEDLILIGVRFFKPEHSILIDKLGIKLYSVEDIREKGTEFYTSLIEQHLQWCDKIYLSFDVDSLDCETVSQGTGTPEANGLYLNEAIVLIQTIMANPKVCCLEISEVNPVLDDKGNAMGEAAWQVLEAALVRS